MMRKQGYSHQSRIQPELQDADLHLPAGCFLAVPDSLITDRHALGNRLLAPL